LAEENEEAKKSARSFFGLDGGEFMGTGMTLEEWSATLELEKIHNSFVTQPRTEQRRRLDFVIKLAVEGSRIRSIDNFGSIRLESGVEYVMEGAWEKVADEIKWCSFEGVLSPLEGSDRESEYSKEVLEEGREQEKEYAKLWEPFKKLLQQAYDSRIDKSQQRH